MKRIKTLIIGGGVSGMACGKKLNETGEEFLLVSKAMGGRMLTSQSHIVNYGASYITSEYKHTWPFMSGRERIWIHQCQFFDEKELTTFYCKRTLRSLWPLIKLYFIARDFKHRLRALRKMALYEEQQDVLASDTVLSRYVKLPAKEFIIKNGLGDLNEVFFSPLFYSTGFIDYTESNTFHYLDCLMEVFCRIYVADHSHCCKDLMQGWEDRVIMETVRLLKKTKDGRYLVRTNKSVYSARNVVLAIPYKDAHRLYPVPKPERNVPIYTFEIKGQRKKVYSHKPIVFFKPLVDDITILWRQRNGNDIAYSKFSKPKLDDYYASHKIVKRIYWPTGTVISGSKWVPQILDKGLYLASDYNILGLEDAFITGVFAANQIIGGKKE
ncbi:NAD(P)-binding protein [Candidatus Woesearchaeota archaeon]|nr:NAD(P)-binding protein [Candidatus Woesearchaeota archaeon]